MMMKLMTKEIQNLFKKTGRQEDVEDPIVVAHFFNPSGSGDWWATEYFPEEREFFGYVSIFGDHCDEWGYFSLDELESVKGPFGLGIERDLYFEPKPISQVCTKAIKKIEGGAMIRVREAVVRYKAGGVVSETISNPLGVYEFFSQKVRGETRENFYCLYMNARNGMVCFELVAMGGAMGAVVDVRSIVRTALLVGAERLILVHNHPSGNPTPSVEDKAMTHTVSAACKIFNIEVLDHVVIGDGKYSSLKEMGDL